MYRLASPGGALPQLRVVLCGRRWRELVVPDASGRLVYDVAADVRERVVDELRPDVAGMWSDPRERLGLR
jgi:hypothetical protein